MIDYVTGSSGFIGSHLISKLADKVICVPHDEILRWEYRDCRNFWFLSAYGNLAGQNDIPEILRANVGGVGGPIATIAEGLFSCEHFVFMSSSSVTLPVQTPYSRAKRAAEEIVLASGIPAAIVRPYSVTGRGEQAQHLIPTIIRSCFEGTPMKLVPDATHDFVDVEDICDGLIALAAKKATGVFEFGTGLAWTNGDVLNLVEEITGRPANVTLVENSMRNYDSLDWKCRDFSARQVGWQPKKSLSHSVSEMVEEYKLKHEHT